MKNNEEKQINALKAHLALNVRDVTKSIDFYSRMLGIAPAKVRTGYAKFDVQAPPLNLTLNQAPFQNSGALSHLGIQVEATEDVIAMRDRWRAAGLAAREEMQTDCCYALQDKAWVSDPDGNEWEVFAVLEDGLPEKPEGSAGRSCCVPAATDTSGAAPEGAVSCC